MKHWQIIVGIGLVLLGIFALVEVLTGINLGRLVFPLLLIGFGVYLVLRPTITGRDIQVELPILGDVCKNGPWGVSHHEIWMFVGATRLDFADAVFPEGDGKIKLFGFVNDLKIILPDDVGLRLVGLAFVSEFLGPQGTEETFMSMLEYETPNYSNAEKRVQIQTLGFVSEVEIKPPVM